MPDVARNNDLSANSPKHVLAVEMSQLESHVTVQKRAYYSPPWADVSIIAVAGSSGSGKSTLSQTIVKKLNLPWVVILSMA